jgi:hypothetical protein
VTTGSSTSPTPQRTRLTRRGWLVLVGLPAFLLAIMLASRLRPGWVVVDKRGTSTVWQRGNVQRMDGNGDRRIDEETLLGPDGQPVRVRRDTDNDGWYDLAHEFSPLGMPVNLRSIRERTPRH